MQCLEAAQLLHGNGIDSEPAPLLVGGQNGEPNNKYSGGQLVSSWPEWFIRSAITMWRPQLQIVPLGEPGGFSDNAAKYRCCCRCCHVKTGTLIIALLEAACVLFQLINAVYFISITQDKSRGIVGLVAVIIVSLIIAILFLGWTKENAWLLLPHLVLQAIAILITVGLICYVFIASNDKVQNTFDVTYRDQSEQPSTTSIKAVIGIGLAIALGYQLFAFTVVFGCYRYFRDKAVFFVNAQAAVDNQQSSVARPTQWGNAPEQMMHTMPYPSADGTTAIASPHSHIQAMQLPPMQTATLPPPYAQNTTVFQQDRQPSPSANNNPN